MNIQNIRAIIKVLRKDWIIQNPASAFRVFHRVLPVIGARHSYRLDYADPTIESCLKTLAKELSLTPVLDQISNETKETYSCEPDKHHLLQPVLDRAAEVLIGQLETAKAFLSR
ncbi:MAG: hypothetical protein WCW31_03580 [Patescibacteria group bacterium]|jgi:hypothetical protein